tara:strand:- start:557 stop:1174 length:618 start_codon:yes stop_codon:yes gene_type:complete
MNLKIYYCFLVVFFATSSSLFSQNTAVGIGTTDPRMKLEVAGDALLRSGVSIGVIDNLKDDDTSTFLVQEGNARIKSLDVSNPTGAALGYIQVYEIYNPNEDWVLDFDTKVNATDFVLNAISASYDRELDLNRDSTIPYYSAFIQNDTWHIKADFPAANNRNSAEKGTWTVTTLIYSNDLSKQFGKIDISMDGGTAQTAANPFIN